MGVNRLKQADEEPRKNVMDQLIPWIDKLIDTNVAASRDKKQKFANVTLLINKVLLRPSEDHIACAHLKDKIHAIPDMYIRVTVECKAEGDRTLTRTFANGKGSPVSSNADATHADVERVMDTDQEKEKKAEHDTNTHFDVDSAAADVLSDESQIATIPHIVADTGVDNPPVPAPKPGTPKPTSASSPSNKKLGNSALKQLMKEAGDAAAPPKPVEKKSIWARLFGKKKPEAKKGKK